MDDNPYKSPAEAGTVQPKPPYTPLRLMVDVFCIAAPLAPIGLGVAVKFFDLQPLPTAAARMTLLATMTGCWLASVVLNLVGSLRRRAVSYVGVVLNVFSLALVSIAP
jgi:hypothetical protein